MTPSLILIKSDSVLYSEYSLTLTPGVKLNGVRKTTLGDNVFGKCFD